MLGRKEILLTAHGSEELARANGSVWTTFCSCDALSCSLPWLLEFFMSPETCPILCPSLGAALLSFALFPESCFLFL